MTALAAPAVASQPLPLTGGVDRAIRVSTAIVVLAVAGIAAYISYWHAYAVVRQYGESGVTAQLEPATIDGLVYASSMVILYAARHRLPVPRLARWMLTLGILASFAVNLAQGWSHGLVGAMVAAWPAVSLVGSYELLAWIIRTAAASGPDRAPEPDHDRPLPDHPGTGPWSVPGPAPAGGPANRHQQVIGLEPVSGDNPQSEAPAVSADPRTYTGLNHPDRTADHPNHPDRTADHPNHPDRTADQPNHPDRAADHPDQPGRADRVPGWPPAVRINGGERDTNAAAVAAYRASLQDGQPISERKLAAMFGKTSRRWARSRITEARQSLAPV